MPNIPQPWSGILAICVFLIGMEAWSQMIGMVARKLTSHTLASWRQLRIDRFWLMNALLAPLLALYWALAAWLLRLTPNQLGLNAHALGLSLSVGLGFALLLGIPSAIQAPILVRRGLSPMQVDFGRSLLDVFGVIGYGLLLVGPVEEIPFRGIIQTVFMRALPVALRAGPFAVSLGTIAGALVFVAYHYRNVILGGETNAQFFRLLPGRLIASLILSLLFAGTGSLLGPILFHNVLDTCTFASLAISQYLRHRHPLPASLVLEGDPGRI